MKTMDRRIAQRRHGVNEHRARTRLRVVIGIVVVAAMAAAVYWVIRSPLLAIDRIIVTGAEHSNPGAAIESLGVAEGTPTIDVDAGAVETVLLSDPWIADASVAVTWPGTVEVEITEHVPVAVVQVSNGYAHVTLTGAVVQLLEDSAGMASITIAEPGVVRAGTLMEGAALLGAIEFVTGLPEQLQALTIVTVGADGQISAVVGEFGVRLGRAVDMSSKAAALVAVIDSGVAPDSLIDVTAPRRPAVANPQAEVEGEG